jgi:protein-S-isoprenylcysteine O-methyltransferase Ste14
VTASSRVPGAATATGIRVPPPLLFVAGLAGGYIVHRLWPVDRIPGSVAPAARVVGWILLALWIVLAAWGVATFRRAGTDVIPTRPASALVTTGPFRFTRNPMYLGFTCAYVGAVLVSRILWPLVFLPLVLAALHALVIVREERHLAARFGEAYLGYRARVRRWL